jgi:branched-chain amino acid transport system permease protein
MADSSPYLYTSYTQELAVLNTPFRRRAALVGLIGLMGLPWILGSYELSIINMIGIATVGALGLNVTTGFAGQVNLGHAGFMAVGAFVTAAIAFHIGPAWANFWVVTPVSLTAGAVFGLLIGLPCLRLRGLYLAMATLAFYFVVMHVALWYLQYLQRTFSTTADIVLHDLNLGVTTISTDREWYYLLLALNLLVIGGINGLLRTKAGRAWIALRDQDIYAEVIGVEVYQYKVLAFVVGAALAAFSGMLYAYYHHVVGLDLFNFEVNVDYLAMIIIGGLGSVAGTVMGAAFIIGIPRILEWGFAVLDVPRQFITQSSAVRLGVFALLMWLFLVLEPEGLVGIWVRIRQFFELWPFSYQPLEARRR